MGEQVIDTSALLAHLLDEPGGALLSQDAGPFVLCSVNLAETLTKLVDRGADLDDAMNVVRRLPIEHLDFGREDARRAAELRPMTKERGLSLGDRACLAVADRLGIPVATADRQWVELSLDIDVRLIR